MSFSKAQDLIRLAQIAAARRGGVSLEDICEEFGVSHRTAQRMTDALEETFGNVEAEDGEDRKRRWRLVNSGLSQLQLRHETGVEALEIAARTAAAEGRLRHAKALNDLRDGMLARVSARARVEADAEAVLMAMGQVTRPGPNVSLQPAILDAIIEALCGVSGGSNGQWLPGGFPKIRPCRWRCAALRPPAYEYRQEGTRNSLGLDLGRTPEASRGIHIGISPASPECTTPSISPWIASERGSVSPSGVSPENVSRDS